MSQTEISSQPATEIAVPVNPTKPAATPTKKLPLRLVMVFVFCVLIASAVSFVVGMGYARSLAKTPSNGSDIVVAVTPKPEEVATVQEQPIASNSATQASGSAQLLSKLPDCATGLYRYDHAVFTICIPDRFELNADTADATKSDNGYRLFTSKDQNQLELADQEQLTLTTDFKGGWGMSTCNIKEKMTLAGFSADRLTFRVEEENGICGDFRQISMLINDDEVRNFMISMQAGKKQTYRDYKEFTAIVDSFVLKDEKPHSFASE